MDAADSVQQQRLQCTGASGTLERYCQLHEEVRSLADGTQSFTATFVLSVGGASLMSCHQWYIMGLEPSGIFSYVTGGHKSAAPNGADTDI